MSVMEVDTGSVEDCLLLIDKVRDKEKTYI